MADAKEIIESVMKASFTDKVYGDVPLLRVASELPKPERPAEPDRVMLMKQMSYSDDSIGKSREQIFCEQGEFMADYEDDREYTGDFTMFYPSYSAMTAEQLHGYFTWRTAVRKGEYRKAPMPFVLVYVYEILNGIGISDPEDGYRRLDAVIEKYGNSDVYNGKLKRWKHDYVIFNRLSPAYLSESSDDSLPVMKNCAEYDDEKLFAALAKLSRYDIAGSTFCKAQPDKLRTVVCSAFRKLSERSKTPLYLQMGGRRLRHNYYMFGSALFWDKPTSESFDYEVNELYRYECRRGVWYVDKTIVSSGGNEKLGDFLRAVDGIMRSEYGFRFRLGVKAVSDEQRACINESIAELRESEKRAQTAKIEIDVSKLGGIRKAADITRGKLIVDDDEELQPEPPVTEAEPEETPAPEEVSGAADETPLDSGEYGFLRCLLYGGDINAAAKAAGTMPSLLADAVNEKLFDIFGDTVLEIGGGEPRVIGDYEDELKELIHR
ncbi:MAG: TerB N-terminal domain-containing protein [Ruminiclostridium sp.]|nr:TerB N-terminal domain-containing protein [Ruminiclostridium sp.]